MQANELINEMRKETEIYMRKLTVYVTNFKSRKRQLIGLVRPLLPKPSVKPCIIHAFYYLRLYIYISLW